MKKAGDFLSNIPLVSPAAGKTVYLEVIKEITNIQLLPTEIVFVGKTIRVLTTPIKKQEILLKKTAILAKLKELQPEKELTNMY